MQAAHIQYHGMVTRMPTDIDNIIERVRPAIEENSYILLLFHVSKRPFVLFFCTFRSLHSGSMCSLAIRTSHEKKIRSVFRKETLLKLHIGPLCKLRKTWKFIRHRVGLYCIPSVDWFMCV